jgi:3D (Asp-Asp-Asp) domain-containing protein
MRAAIVTQKHDAKSASVLVSSRGGAGAELLAVAFTANAAPFADYSYQVVARDKNGKTVASSDPQVIPMGNGGP